MEQNSNSKGLTKQSSGARAWRLYTDTVLQEILRFTDIMPLVCPMLSPRTPRSEDISEIQVEYGSSGVSWCSRSPM